MLVVATETKSSHKPATWLLISGSQVRALHGSF